MAKEVPKGKRHRLHEDRIKEPETEHERRERMNKIVDVFRRNSTENLRYYI